jgi:hypothetical protein
MLAFLFFTVADVYAISPQQPQSEKSSAFLTHFYHQVNGLSTYTRRDALAASDIAF